MGDQSKYMDITYHFVGENVESGQLAFLQVESSENLAYIYTKERSQVTLWKLRNVLIDAK
jgi:hypothetical protein